MSISDRELYKKLKKHKVFSKFCIRCAEVFNGGILSNSLLDYKHFLEVCAKQEMLRDEQHFAREIKNLSMRPPYVRIMQKQE